MLQTAVADDCHNAGIHQECASIPSMTNPNCPPSLIQRRTVKTYEQWLRRFLRFHGMRHLHRELLERDLDLEGVVRARNPQRLPAVLTEEEV